MPEMINDLIDQSNVLKRKTEECAETVEEPKKCKMSSQRKKMCAMMMMYSGVGYFGMQRNEGFRTIEGDILQAMFDAELIDEENFKQPAKIRFQRASKTDKSVSAIGQVCSIKLSDCDRVAELINKNLPPQIRILDVFRTTKSFHAKALCKYRTYRYITPSFVFSPKRITDETELIAYRIDDETIDRVNAVLAFFKGTHNYHNFTSGRTPDDSSCQRYLMSLTCEAPFVDGDREYVSIVINGQSFMLHQIRKMVALTMAVVRGHCDAGVFDRVFQLMKVDLPRAPGLGLVLDRVNYDSYNEKYAVEGERKPIDWNLYRNDIDEFREKFVYAHIFKLEREERSMLSWLNTLSIHSYMFRDGSANNDDDNNNNNDNDGVVSTDS